ncbi:hypothetical protein K435DRAFT_835648, partial [Dendrothele bispora CBS 962.96]
MTSFQNMSDAQLKHAISQLSSAANAGYAPVPSAYFKNLQTWSSTPTPPPRAASTSGTRGGRSSRASAARPTNLTSSTTPATTTASQYYLPQQSQQTYVSQQPPQPAGPKGPLPTTTQALQSTYASRLRTGATLLVQPIIHQQQSTTGASYSGLSGTRSSRRGAVINYADPGSGDDLDADPPDEGAKEVDSDDSDFVASGGVRTTIRQSGRARGNMGTGMGVFNTQGTGSTQAQAQQQKEDDTLDQSYLGQVPPSRFIKSRPIYGNHSQHVYPSSFPSDPSSSTPSKPPSLLPIRVEFETPTHRIRDCFIWNAHDPYINPEHFAKTFCADLELPMSWVDTIANQIRAQVEEGEGVLGVGWEVDSGATSSIGTFEDNIDADLDEGEEAEDDLEEAQREREREKERERQLEWARIEEKWEKWEREAKEKGEQLDVHMVDPGEDAVDEVPECRVILSIDVQIATHHLLDHIEWDLFSPLTPEEFAKTLCTDLGLGGEAIPLVAHAVHEELMKHKRDVVEWGVVTASSNTSGGNTTQIERPPTTNGHVPSADRYSSPHPNRSLLKDHTNKSLLSRALHSSSTRPGKSSKAGHLPRELKSIWRDYADAEEFRTRWEEMTQEEVERRELERERASRRLRREVGRMIGQQAGGGGRRRR